MLAQQDIWDKRVYIYVSSIPTHINVHILNHHT